MKEHPRVSRATASVAHLASAADEAVESVAARVEASVEKVKPHLRGWLHAVTSPLTLAAGIVLIVLSPTAATRAGSSIFMITSVLLFTVSAVYHRGTWGVRAWTVLRGLDHSNIFLLIAGSYTPFSLLLLEGTDRTVLLSVVWGAALGGVFARLVWTSAPRWFFVAVYIAMGWAAVFYIPQFASAASPAVFALIAAGGLLYTVGGVVYGLQRPDPWPTWFGFHEVFHTLTIAAFITHYVGISLATYALR